MSLRGLVIIGFFGLASLMALTQPIWGIAAYALHYHSAPERSWWGSSLASMGVRYSLTISIFLLLGTLQNLHRLPYGRLLVGQETLYLVFIGWIVICRLLNGQETDEDAVDKMLKMALFLLALTHVLVTPRRFTQFSWVLVVCGIYLGRECFNAPRSYYVKGRLEGVGGPDFSDSNALAAHMVALLPIVGIRFLRSGWRLKAVCLVAGALLANGVVQTRSRGGYLAAIIAAGTMLALSPRGHRKTIFLVFALGALGAVLLIDAAYLERMGTLQAGEREKDESAMSRIRFWKAGIQMATDHPLGVGPGNFHTHIGEYLPNEAGRDTHNTYVRCVAELGWPGLGLLVALIINAQRVLAQVRWTATRDPDSQECSWNAYSLQMSLAAYLTSSMFISATYIEMLWWLLMLPAALKRAAANAGPTQAT